MEFEDYYKNSNLVLRKLVNQRSVLLTAVIKDSLEPNNFKVKPCLFIYSLIHSFIFIENRLFSHKIHLDSGSPHPELSPLPFSLISTPFPFPIQKRAGLQEMTVKQDTIRQGKSHPIEAGQGNPKGGKVPRDGKRLRRNSAPTVRSPTEPRANSRILFSEKLVQTRAGAWLASSSL